MVFSERLFRSINSALISLILASYPSSTLTSLRLSRWRFSIASAGPGSWTQARKHRAHLYIVRTLLEVRPTLLNRAQFVFADEDFHKNRFLIKDWKDTYISTFLNTGPAISTWRVSLHRCWRKC